MTGWVWRVLARGAQPCVLLCGLPDSRPGYRWHRVSASRSAGTLTQTIGYMDTQAQQIEQIDTNWTWKLTMTFFRFSWVRIHFHTKLKWCIKASHLPTDIFFQYCIRMGQKTHSGRCRCRRVLTNCEGRTTGTSTWLGANTWGPVMVNKISG